MAMTKCQECSGDVSTLAAACPKCGAPVKPATPGRGGASGSGSPVLKYGAIAIAVLVVAMVATKPEKKPAVPYDPAPTAAELARHKAATAGNSTYSDVLTTTIEDMASDYDANTVAADAKYKGRRVSLTATVGDISTDVANNAFLMLRGQSPGSPTVRAVLHDSQRQTAANLSRGQTVKVDCTGDGDILKRPQLKGCILSPS